MIRVIYDPKFGTSLADGEVETFVSAVICGYNYSEGAFPENKPLELVIGNGLILDFFRKALVEGKFDKMEVKFGDKIIPVDEYGRLAEWPLGLADYQRTAIVSVLKVRPSRKEV